jgi:hypothetical protein
MPPSGHKTRMWMVGGGLQVQPSFLCPPRGRGAFTSALCREAAIKTRIWVAGGGLQVQPSFIIQQISHFA